MSSKSNKATAAAAGRKFGLTVGLAFIALGLVARWRGKVLTSTVLLALGGLLVLAALAMPAQLGPVERAWMGLAHMISKVTTPIFMGVVYYVVLTPIGLIRRRAGSPMTAPTGPLKSASRWAPHTPAVADAARMERQF
jgi:hypothetical protein